MNTAQQTEWLTEAERRLSALYGKLTQTDIDDLLAHLRSAVLASAQPAGAVQEPLTDSYLQVVPDKCDRIVWRNHYYHLPIKPSPVPSGEVLQQALDARALGFELAGVIADVEQGSGFDEVCLETIKRVRASLAAQPPQPAAAKGEPK